MNIWESKKWEKYCLKKSNRSGIRLDFDANIDQELRMAFKRFVAWVKKRYKFPVRVRVYVKNKELVKLFYVSE